MARADRRSSVGLSGRLPMHRLGAHLRLLRLPRALGTCYSNRADMLRAPARQRLSRSRGRRCRPTSPSRRPTCAFNSSLHQYCYSLGTDRYLMGNAFTRVLPAMLRGHVRNDDGSLSTDTAPLASLRVMCVTQLPTPLSIQIVIFLTGSVRQPPRPEPARHRQRACI